MKLDWRGALGIALSAGALWWTLHDVDLAKVWRVLSSSNLALWIACTTAATAIFPLRARRWAAQRFGPPRNATRTPCARCSPNWPPRPLGS